MPPQTPKVGEEIREPEDWGGRWILAFVRASNREKVSVSFSLPPDGESPGGDTTAGLSKGAKAPLLQPGAPRPPGGLVARPCTGLRRT